MLKRKERKEMLKWRSTKEYVEEERKEGDVEAEKYERIC